MYLGPVVAAQQVIINNSLEVKIYNILLNIVYKYNVSLKIFTSDVIISPGTYFS